MYVLFYVCEVIGFVDWLDREVYKYEKSLEMCICFDCPEVTLCGWQDIKIQLLTIGSCDLDLYVKSLKTFFGGKVTYLLHAKLSFYLS